MSPHYAIRVGLARAQLQPCLLCGSAEIVGAAVFEPDDPSEFGAPPGKRRLLFYALCAGCVGDGDEDFPQEAIEDALLAQGREAVAT